MTTDSVYQDAIAPETFDVTIRSGDSGADMTTATGATMYVRTPSGAELTWAATLTAATTKTVIAQHLFAAGDLPELGTHRVFVALVVPGGTIRTRVEVFEVLGRFEGENCGC